MVSNSRRTPVTVCLYLFGLVWAFFILAPFAWLFLLSIKSRLDAFAIPPKLIFTPTFESYHAIFTDADFLSAIVNSLVVACSSVLLSLLIAAPAAFALRNLYGGIRRPR